jgi:cell wall-associated NlpC family hydrolase
VNFTLHTSGRSYRNSRTALMSRTERRADRVPGGPGQAAVRAALAKLGRPYMWGAKGPNSFDCSGPTGWAWRQAGIQLGADTYQQIHDGIAVPPGQVRTGDLIFPKDSFSAAAPGHVQLAISPTQVIHRTAAQRRRAYRPDAVVICCATPRPAGVSRRNDARRPSLAALG